MEKRRVRLEINGVICGLITQESDEYMKSLADEVSEMLEEIQIASPYITREAAALTVALNYCDDARKNGQKRKQLQERVDELEVEAEVWHEERADMVQNGPNPETRARMENLERRNNALQEIAGQVDELRRRVVSLEKENRALEEQSQKATQLEPMRQELEQLREENQRLRQGVATPENESLLEELEKLAADNAALKLAAEEKDASSKRRSRRSSPPWPRPSAPWRRPSAWWIQARAQAPTGAAGPEQSELVEPALPEEDEAGDDPQAHHRRKNPLRHDEEFEQDGFVSFFEKK